MPNLERFGGCATKCTHFYYVPTRLLDFQSLPLFHSQRNFSPHKDELWEWWELLVSDFILEILELYFFLELTFLFVNRSSWFLEAAEISRFCFYLCGEIRKILIFGVRNFDFSMNFGSCIPWLSVDFFEFVENLEIGFQNFEIIFIFLKSTWIFLHFGGAETIIRRLSSENQFKTYFDFLFSRPRLEIWNLLPIPGFQVWTRK